MTEIISLSTPISLKDGSIESVNFTVVADGREHITRSVAKDHPNFEKVMELVTAYQNGDLEAPALGGELLAAADLERAFQEEFKKVEGILDGRMAMKGGAILVDGDPIDPTLQGHILRLLNEKGEPRNASNWRAFARFVENLYSNSSEFVRQQLFGWLSYQMLHGDGFTLTEDGCFVGYKGCAGTVDAPLSVRAGSAIVNGKRVTGQIPNPVGAVVEMPRSQVQADPSVGCSHGLHIGTYNYAKDWAKGVLLLVKVNPRDVVSVPTECQAQKIRACRYEVLEVTEGPHNGTTYYPAAETLTATVDEKTLATLQEAASAEATVEFTYKGEARSLTVSSVERKRRGWVATGLNEHGDYRSYRVDLMSDLRVLTDEASGDGTPAGDSTSADLAVLQDAAAANSIVEFTYRGGKRTLTVEEVARGTHGWVVTGLNDDGEHRSYRVDRMSDLRVLTPASSLDAVLDRLRAAARAGLDVEFTYKGTKRTLTVDEVFRKPKGWVVTGLSPEGEHRSYRVDRIKNLSI